MFSLFMSQLVFSSHIPHAVGAWTPDEVDDEGCKRQDSRSMAQSTSRAKQSPEALQTCTVCVCSVPSSGLICNTLRRPAPFVGWATSRNIRNTLLSLSHGRLPQSSWHPGSLGDFKSSEITDLEALHIRGLRLRNGLDPCLHASPGRGFVFPPHDPVICFLLVLLLCYPAAEAGDLLTDSTLYRGTSIYNERAPGAGLGVLFSWTTRQISMCLCSLAR